MAPYVVGPAFWEYIASSTGDVDPREHPEHARLCRAVTDGSGFDAMGLFFGDVSALFHALPGAVRALGRPELARACDLFVSRAMVLLAADDLGSIAL